VIGGQRLFDAFDIKISASGNMLSRVGNGAEDLQGSIVERLFRGYLGGSGQHPLARLSLLGAPPPSPGLGRRRIVGERIVLAIGQLKGVVKSSSPFQGGVGMVVLVEQKQILIDLFRGERIQPWRDRSFALAVWPALHILGQQNRRLT